MRDGGKKGVSCRKGKETGTQKGRWGRPGEEIPVLPTTKESIDCNNPNCRETSETEKGEEESQKEYNRGGPDKATSENGDLRELSGKKQETIHKKEPSSDKSKCNCGGSKQ